MINDYPYAELFREHNVKKDMIIVDRTAQITPVSDHDPTIVGTYIFTTEDIKVESFDLTERLCSEDDLTFGLCSSSQVKITVKNKPEYPNLKDEVLKIYIYFNGDSDTLFEVGQYMVDTDAYSDDRRFRDLSMFDLLYFLRDYDITEWYNGIYADNNNQALKISVLVNDLMRWLSADENIPITYDTLPQINYTIPKNVTADNITFGFFLQPLLEVLGLFGHIDRTGKVVYKSLEWYDKPAVRTVTDDWRKPPTTWKDQYTWGIGQIDVYDENNIRLFYYRNTDKKHPSIYTIADSFVFSSRKADDAEAKALLEYMWGKTTHIRYKPYEAKTIGDLCVEVGDRIDVQCGDVTFYTYVFERHLTGIQSMRDEYSARGNKKQPKYIIEKGSSYDDQGEGSSGSGTGGVSNVDNTDITDFCEYIRNIGFRLLDEPSNVDVVYDKANGQVEIKWTDPSDISTYAPIPCVWAGTVVVRREKEPPRHIWDGTIITTSTTRDAYSSNALVDSTIDQNKRYYYGIFPYHVALDDNDHPINHYRFTKVVSVDTTYDLSAPTIEDLEVSGVDVTVTYDIPEIDGLYSYCKLVVKKGGIPADVEDGDQVINLNESLTEIEVTGLDAESRYYFVIFTSDTDDNTASSEPKDIVTGTPVLDPVLVDMLNGDGFFWKDWNASIVYGTYDTTMTWNGSGNYKAYTWVTNNGDPVTTSSYKTTTGGVAFIAVEAKQTLFINKTTNGYTGTISLGSRISNQWKGPASVRWQDAKFAYKNGTTQWSDWPDGSVNSPGSLSYSGETIRDVLEYFAKRLRNVYIAVDDNTLYDMAKTHSMTNVQGYVTSSIDESSVNNLSSYFGTDRILRIEHSSWQSSYIRSFDGYTAGCDTTNGLVFTYSYIPINRTKVKSIRFKAIVPTQYGQQNAMIQVKTAYFSGNTMMPNAGSVSWNPNWQGTWQEYVLSYTEPVDADYIQIKTGYNDWYIKDMVIYSEG